MHTVSLAQAEALMDAALQESRRQSLRPMSVVVTDQGCSVIAFKKEDGSSALRMEMARGKCYASIALGRSSILVRERQIERPHFMNYMLALSDNKIFPEGGGRLIRDQNGDLLGAIGVTGDLHEKDDEIAAFAIRAAGFKCDEDCTELGKLVRLTNV